jgi:ABC-2 type transport system permease protein
MRPVPRGRLLVAKAIVAGVFIWAATILVVLAGLVAGLILFGAHTVNVPGFLSIAGGGGSAIGGFELGRNVLLLRIALATGYVAFGLTALLAMGTFFSVVTDTSAGAIGGTIGVYIVSEILDAIQQFGRLRYGFPTHYLDAWQSMFSDNKYSHDMLAGVVVQLAYLAVFGAAAFWWFSRKDIRS